MGIFSRQNEKSCHHLLTFCAYNSQTIESTLIKVTRMTLSARKNKNQKYFSVDAFSSIKQLVKEIAVLWGTQLVSTRKETLAGEVTLNAVRGERPFLPLASMRLSGNEHWCPPC